MSGASSGKRLFYAQNQRKNNFFEENMKKVAEKFGGTEKC